MYGTGGKSVGLSGSHCADAEFDADDADAGAGAGASAGAGAGTGADADADADTDLGVSLAWSLHAVDATLRSALVPRSHFSPIALREGLCATLRRRAPRRRKLVVEYVLLSGVNDDIAQVLAHFKDVASIFWGAELIY
eukprot:780927-Pleurochrysis_carterae.AAC.1